MDPFKVKFRVILAQLLVLLTLTSAIQAQSTAQKRKIFTQAETYYLYEDYELANTLFLQLETQNNLNIKYKIGNCYLRIPGEKSKAIPYLEAAIKDVSYEAKTDNFKEKSAPLDAYFSLAKAYMINNEYDKAIKTLETFKKLVYDASLAPGMKNFGYIDQQILACRNAMRMMEEPIKYTKEILGSDINQGAVNDNATISFDGNTLAYTEHRGIVNVILCARKVDGVWQKPVDITKDIGAGDDCSTCSLNNDGSELFLYKNDNWDGSIYSAECVNGTWSRINKLNRNINTKYYESHASVSPDGKSLYFTSNREGGFGNLDIYVSRKDEEGEWGEAENLGTSINTPFNEDTPFIAANDSMLCFSSEGHSSMGGYDIFMSRGSGMQWETPVNLGYPVNTSDDDRFFHPWNNDKNAYYSIWTGYKKKDIFYLDFSGPAGSIFTEIKGKISLSDTIMTYDKTFRINLIDKSSGDTVDVGYPNMFTGTYSFFAMPGKYHIVYTGHGYLTQTIDTTILKNNLSALNLDILLERDPNMKNVSRKYDKLNFKNLPTANSVDSTLLIKNLHVNDVNDRNVDDSKILYYTVQVMALHKPVDLNYFKFVPDMKVMYNDRDRFFRYTTGIFHTREDAISWKNELLRRGYPDDIFIKKVSR